MKYLLLIFISFTCYTSVLKAQLHRDYILMDDSVYFKCKIIRVDSQYVYIKQWNKRKLNERSIPISQIRNYTIKDRLKIGKNRVRLGSAMLGAAPLILIVGIGVFISGADLIGNIIALIGFAAVPVGLGLIIEGSIKKRRYKREQKLKAQELKQETPIPN